MMGETKRTLEELAVSPFTLAEADGNTPVLLALSGGRDSVALLHWLSSLRKRKHFPLTLCHLHHGIRGEEADRDQHFCEALAASYGLPIVVGHADVPARVARTGESVEEAAREERYAFFARIMQEQEIPMLVTAHHADDQLETVLFRLARGTGTQGLSGISPARLFADGCLLRPLLRVTRAQITDYCTRHALSYVEDSTNGDDGYARNRLRHGVLPVLEELFPGVAERVSSLADGLREDEEYLDQLAGKLVLINSTRDYFSLEALRDAPPPVRRRAIRRWVQETCGSCLSVHVEALLRFLSDAPPGMEVALPSNRICVLEGTFLRLYPRGGVGTLPPTPLRLGKEMLLGTWQASTVRLTGASIKIHNSSTSPYIFLKEDFDIIKSGLHWRSRREGDVLLQNGMHKRLRRLQAEADVPVYLRPSLPLLCDGEGIVWAPGIGVRDGAAAEVGDACGLCVRLTRG